VELPILALLIRYLRRERVYADFTFGLLREEATITPEMREQVKWLYADRERARAAYDEALRSSAHPVHAPPSPIRSRG
jgi:hypothetical protein